MSEPAADRNLLFGILALQNDLVTRDQLVAAMHEWVLEKRTPLEQILKRRGSLQADEAALLGDLVKKQVARHAGDIDACVTALSSAREARAALNEIPDEQVQATCRILKPQTEPFASTSAFLGRSADETGRFTILRPHAEGGLGEVFVARDNELDREVALKQIKEAYSTNSQQQSRFKLEAEVTGGLEHPGIVPVYSLGSDADGRPFYAMRFIRGASLKEAIDRFHSQSRGKPDFASLEFRGLLRRFIDVCNAIAYAHSRGILHRDLKPGNIMLGKFGETLVVDWGLAKALGISRAGDSEASLGPLTPPSASGTGFGATAPGSLIGTPAYMSPEQARGELDQLGPATDVYSLGATLYTVLTGNPSIGGKAVVEILESVRLGKFHPPREVTVGVPRPLEAVCLKAMALEPCDRYAGAFELASELERWLADEPVAVFPEPMAARVRRWTRKHPGQVGSLAAAVFVGLVSLAVGLGVVGRKNQQLASANAELADKNEKLDAAVMRESAERARAEQQRLEAQAQKKIALERLEQIERINNTVFDVFTEFDIRKIKKSGEPVEYVLAGKLVEAGKKLDAKTIHDPLVLAGLQHRLGVTLISLGRATEAIELLTAARAMRQSKLGPDHPETLNSMNNLASGYQDAGRLEQALQLFEETLKMKKARLGAEHPDLLVSMNNLALGYRATGNLDRALPLLEETLRLRKARLGADHPNTLTSMANLASAYEAAGKLDRALPLHEETLNLMKTRLGPEHPDTLATMNNLASGYLIAGKRNQALPLYEETLKLMKARLGADHPVTLSIMNNLASGYQAAGKLDRALPLLEETLRLKKAKVGTDHPDTLTSATNLAWGYQAAGKLDQALPLYEEAARGVEKRRFQHEHATRIIPNTISAFEAAGQDDRADEWRRKWLGFMKEGAGLQSPSCARELAQWGRSLLHRQNWAEAESKLRESLAIREKTQADAWTTFHTQSMLGAALMRQGKYAEAEPLLLKGYEGVRAREKSIPPQSKVRPIEALDHLISFYIATNKPDAVTKWQAERAKYSTVKSGPPQTPKD